ncbi:MAG: tRNA pseudouridine(55) synthase TruB [Pseudomonadota bacterium]
MARRTRGRPIDGLFLLDKPKGLTSNQALQRAKWLFDARKAGHTGSLDPLATGLLPLCFGHGTKVSAFLLDADKTYEVQARFGERTDTADADGVVVENGGRMPTASDLEAGMATLTGPIEQIPPMYSALKKDGKRLYELARLGQKVERAARPVTIHRFELLGVDQRRASFRVRCSKGTYIRSLIEDLASAVGTIAHVGELRRTGVGPFGDHPMRTLDDLSARRGDAGPEVLDNLLLPVDTALLDWPAVTLPANAAHFYANGQAVHSSDCPANGDVRTYDQQGRFLGIGRAVGDGRIAPKRLFC